jgi:hypothetical protein
LEKEFMSALLEKEAQQAYKLGLRNCREDTAAKSHNKVDFFKQSEGNIVRLVFQENDDGGAVARQEI